MDQTGFANPLSNTFYALVAPRICTNPHVAERVISALFDDEVSCNDAKGETPFENMTPFHALEAPSIVVGDYVRRISQYAFSSTACMLAAFYYVKRAVKAQRALAPTSLSVHRLLITAVVLAAKYFDDITYSMGYYAKVGGLPVKELAYLELRMLDLLDFRLHISPADFHTLEQDLIVTLHYIPRSPIAFEAREALHAAKIGGKRFNFCEAMHDSDTVGLWRPHPTPDKPMLPSLEGESSPCTSPVPVSPRRDTSLQLDEEDEDDICDTVDYAHPHGSGEFHKQFSNMSTSTVSSSGSMRSPGCTPKIRAREAPGVFVSRRRYTETSNSGSGRCATALTDWAANSSPPTPDTRTQHEGNYATSAYRMNDEEQAKFEDTVRMVNETRQYFPPGHMCR